MKKLLKLKFIIPAIVAIAAGITLPIVLIPHTHKVVDETWLNDATNHWHACSNCDEFVDLAEHEFGEWENVTGKCQKAQACLTCGYVVTEDVAHTYDDACDETCNVCGTERSTDHKYGTLVAKVDPTCEEEGLHAHYKCSDCNSYFDETKKEVTYSSLVINALGHTCGELIPEVAADCINTGLKAHYKCAACEQYFDAENNKVTYDSLVIAAEGHYLSNVPANPATCVTDGTIAHKHCSVCEKNFDADGNELTSVVVTAPGHKLGTLVAEKPATCGEAGLKAHYKCSGCDKYYDEEENEVTYESLVITAKSHEYGELIEEVKSTCLTTGIKAHYECINCDVLFNTEKEEVKAEDLVIAIGDHVYGELIAEKAAKCETTGLEAHYKCSVCEKLFQDVEEVKTLVSLEDITISAIGHSYGEPTYTWNSDYSKCTATKTCTNDASHVLSETVDATYEVTVQPSEEDGEGVYTSNVFADPDFEVQTHTVVLPAINHTYDSEPTYTWNADNTVCTATIKCSDEGCDKVITEESTATVVTVAATCETAGSVSYNAVFNNSLFKGQTKVEEIKALGHAYGEVSYVWNNDNSKVTATRICANNDSHVDAETVNTTSTTVEPKCEVAGKTTYKAEFENEAFQTQTKVVDIDALEHVLGEASYNWAVDHSSCTATVKCTLCTVIQEQETVNSTSITTATCTEAGVATFTVTFEGDVFETQVKEGEPQEALGHDFEEFAAEAPTCTEDGYLAHLHCKRCNKNFNADEEEFETVVVEKLGHELNYSNDKATCKNECGLSFALYYIKGTINDWNALPEYRLVVDADNKKATILIEIFENEEFKISGYNKDWLGWSKLSNSIKDKTVLEAAAEDDNIRCKKDGIFLITADYSGATVKFTIEKVEHTHTKAENAEYTIDDKAHYYACTTCLRGKIEYEEHIFDTKKACQTTCPTCEYVRTTKVQHTYDHGCDTDCNVCSETRTVDPHAYGTKVEKVAATCTTDGNVAHYQCSTCNQYFDVNYNVIKSVVIEKLGHDYAKTWYSDEHGHYHICTRINCGMKDEVVPHIPGTAATETTPQTCTVCEYVIVPALGHTCVFTEVEDSKYEKTAATCIAKAVYYKSCSCGAKSEETFKGSSYGDHNLDDIEAEVPSCTETGLLAHEKCTLCGQLILNDKEVELKDVTISANGHDKELEHHAVESATCTQTGKLEYWSCNSCDTKFKENSSTEENIITDITAPAKGHTLTYGTDIVKQDDYEIHFDYAECSVCKLKQNMYYVKGNFLPTTWDDSIEGRFDFDLTKGQATITLNLKVGDTFKVGTTDGWEFTSETMTGWNNDFIKLTEGMDWANLKCKNAGLYTITISGLLKGQTKSAAISKYTGEHTTHTYSEELFHNDTQHWNYCLVCRTINKANHELGEIIPEQASNCTETGLAAHYLCECGQYFDSERVAVEEETLVLDIKHTYESVVTAPTCTEEGYTTYICECGDSYIDDKVNALGHNMVTDSAVAPTCTETGLTEGSHCSRCDDATTEQTKVKALGHNMVTDEAVPPTCTETGLTEGSHCSRCDDATTLQEEVDALGHDMIIDEAVPATCTETGLTEGSHCSRCNGATTVQEVVRALGHNTVIDKAVEPTCIENGLTAGSHCSRCDDATVEQETVPAKGHNMITDTAVEPTCTETGLTAGSHCSRCDYKVVQETVDALGHDMITDAAVEPTCTETGLTAGSHCSRCDYKVVQETVNALGHSLSDVAAKDKTCTTNGNIAHKHCSICENNFDEEEHKLDNVTILASHEYGTLHERVEAKCEVPGNNAYYQCSDCEEYFNESKVKVSLEDIIISKLEHTYEKEWSSNESQHYHRCTRIGCDGKIDVEDHIPGDPATETHAQTCTECDYVITPMLDHTCVFEEEVVDSKCLKTPATCNSKAVYYLSCSGENCTKWSTSEDDTFEYGEFSNQHNYGTLIAEVAKSCTTDGKEAHYKCSVCYLLFQDVIVEEVTEKHLVEDADLIIPASHELTDVAAKDKTCTTNGNIAHKHCVVCENNFDEEEHKLDNIVILASHEYNEVVTAPTCTEKGYTTYTCSVCTHSYTGNEVAANDHDYDEVITVPTCTEKGYTTYTCSVCSHSYTGNETAATGHKYNEPKYEWKNENSQVEIYRTCINDYCNHREDEIVNKESLMISQEPNCTTPGAATYTTTEFSEDLEVEIEVPALGHDWKEADCTNPKTCKTCGTSEGKSLGHSWVNATCTSPKICSVCDATEGEALGHSYTYEVTTIPTKDTEGSVTLTCSTDLNHTLTQSLPSLNDTDYTHGKEQYENCELGGTCEYTYNELIGNKEITFEVKLASKGHDWVDATCTTAKTCSTCNKVEGKALGHDYSYDYLNGKNTCNDCSTFNENLTKSSWSLKGITDWETGNVLFTNPDDNNIAIVELKLNAGCYTFKLHNGTNTGWKGNDGAIDKDTAGIAWEMNGSGNCGLIVRKNSLYRFTYNINDNKLLVEVVEEYNTAVAGSFIYLSLNSNWKSDGRIALYYCNGTSKAGWLDMMKMNDGKYIVFISSSINYKNIIFCRMNTSTTENNWDNRWDQTTDLTPGQNNLFTIKEGDWNNATGSWSKI